MKRTIREWRARFGFSQHELAQRLGITQQYVSHIENGRYQVSKAMAKDVANVFGCQVSDVVELSNTRPMARIAAAISSLPEYRYKQVLQILEIPYYGGR